jgi:hypothetical protein
MNNNKTFRPEPDPHLAKFLDPYLRGMKADPKHGYEQNSKGTAFVLSAFSQCCGPGSGRIVIISPDPDRHPGPADPGYLSI